MELISEIIQFTDIQTFDDGIKSKAGQEYEEHVNYDRSNQRYYLSVPNVHALNYNW